PPSIATRVEHHYAIPAGDEEKSEGLIERQPFRSIVAAAGEPRRRDPPAPHVDPQRAILVLEVGEEDAARVVDGEAFGLPVQGDLGLPRQRAPSSRIDDGDRVGAWGR